MTLVYYNAALSGMGADETHLAWCVPIVVDCVSPQGCGSRRLFIDGDSGEVLAIEENATHCDKDFDINHANGTTSSNCWNLPWETADDEMYDEDGRWCGFSEACATTTADGSAAFNAAHRTYDYFANTFGRCGWDGDDAQLEVMVHVGFNPANAEYNRGCDCVAFSNGYVQPASFAHEYSHAITRWTAGLMSNGESGALNEPPRCIIPGSKSFDFGVFPLNRVVFGLPAGVGEPHGL